MSTDFPWFMSYGVPAALAAIGTCFLGVIWLKKIGPIEFREDRRELTIATGAICILVAFLLLFFRSAPTPTPSDEEQIRKLVDKYLATKPPESGTVFRPPRVKKVFTSVAPQRNEGPVLQNSFRVEGRAAYLLVSGSAFSEKKSTTLSMAVEVNGRTIGKLHSFSNEESSHKRFVSAVIRIPDEVIATRSLNLTLRLGSGTLADQNDRFDVTLLDF